MQKKEFWSHEIHWIDFLYFKQSGLLSQTLIALILLYFIAKEITKAIRATKHFIPGKHDITRHNIKAICQFVRQEGLGHGKQFEDAIPDCKTMHWDCSPVSGPWLELPGLNHFQQPFLLTRTNQWDNTNSRSNLLLKEIRKSAGSKGNI